MPQPYSLGGIHLDVDLGRSPVAAKPEPETPFRIAVLGDFSGRASRGVVETGAKLAARKPLLVDRDNFDAALAGLGVQLELPVAGGIRFRELDDFHPDRLYRNLELFRKLREAREGAGKSASPRPAAPRESGRIPPPPNLGLGGLLDQAIEQTQSQAEHRPAEVKDDFQAWLQQTVAPSLEPKEGPAQAEMRDIIDKAASAQMRSLLHFPAFQALEAAWRSVFFLIRRAETGPDLKIYLIDVSKEELEADLGSVSDLGDSAVFTLLAKASIGVVGGDPWTVLAGNYSFGDSVADLSLLARLASMGRALRAPWISAAESSLLGCESLAHTPDPEDWGREANPGWKVLRRLPAASSLGLVVPRLLQRLPYGAQTDACEAFSFEEMAGSPEHEDYLWGNGVFACAALLAQSFAESGWEMRPGTHANIDRLPLHVYKRDGEPVCQPCAEILMTEDAADKILESGLMPLATMKDTAEVRLVRFQSIANPPQALAGPWA